MGAAVFEGNDVVHLGCWCHPAFSLAVLTQWVGCDVSVADFAPRVVVADVDFRVAPRPVVVGFCLFEMSVRVAVAGIG